MLQLLDVFNIPIGKVTKTSSKPAILDLPIRKQKFYEKHCTRILWFCNNTMNENLVGGRRSVLYLPVFYINLPDSK